MARENFQIYSVQITYWKMQLWNFPYPHDMILSLVPM